MDRNDAAAGDEQPVQQDKSTATMVVVDNVPKVEMKRYKKLNEVIGKIFAKYGTIIDDGLNIPVDGDPQMTCGYAFIEYETAEMATRAVLEGNMKVGCMDGNGGTGWAPCALCGESARSRCLLCTCCVACVETGQCAHSAREPLRRLHEVRFRPRRVRSP